MRQQQRFSHGEIGHMRRGQDEIEDDTAQGNKQMQLVAKDRLFFCHNLAKARTVGSLFP